MDLRPVADPTLVVVAAGYAVLWALAAFAGIFGLAMAFALVLSMSRYGYRLLGNFARGRNRNIAPDIESMNPVGDYRVVLHGVLFALLPVLAARAFQLPGGSAVHTAVFLGAVGVAVAWPASAGWLALTSDLAGAMNPWNVLKLVRMLGHRYALLVVCAGLFLFLPTVILAALPVILAVPVDFFLQIWVVLAIFVLTGSELRAHRHAFAIPGELEPADERRERDRRDEWQKSLDQAYASLRSGLKEQGFRTIRELIDREHGSLAVRQWVFDRVLAWEDKSTALAFASRFVEALLEEGQQYDALELITRCRRVSQAFELSPEVARAMADFARSIGRHGIADELSESAQSAAR